MMTDLRRDALTAQIDALRTQRRALKDTLDAAITSAQNKRLYSDAWADSVTEAENLKAALKALDKAIGAIAKAVA